MKWALALAVLVAPAWTQDTPAPARLHEPALLAPERAAAIDAAAVAMLAKSGAPGCSVAVVVARRVAYAAGHGLADVEQRVPATARTSYAWASISKPVTATAVLQLVERGALDLDADVRRYVPAWPEKPEGAITPRHLLAHQSGIPHYGRGGLAYDDRRHYATLAEALAKFRDAPLRFAPGASTRYSTFAYTLLGCAVEAAAGQPFIDHVAAHVFAPAGMATAGRDHPYRLVPDRARGYQRAPDGTVVHAEFHDSSYKIPGGGLRGSVVDLARFLAATMDGTLLAPETFARMATPATLADGTVTDTGLGWKLHRNLWDQRLDVTIVAHGGAQSGVSNWCFMIPAEGFGVAVLCNCERQAEAIARLSHEVMTIARPAPK